MLAFEIRVSSRYIAGSGKELSMRLLPEHKAELCELPEGHERFDFDEDFASESQDQRNARGKGERCGGLERIRPREPILAVPMPNWMTRIRC